MSHVVRKHVFSICECAVPLLISAQKLLYPNFQASKACFFFCIYECAAPLLISTQNIYHTSSFYIQIFKPLVSSLVVVHPDTNLDMAKRKYMPVSGFPTYPNFSSDPKRFYWHFKKNKNLSHTTYQTSIFSYSRFLQNVSPAAIYFKVKIKLYTVLFFT